MSSLHDIFSKEGRIFKAAGAQPFQINAPGKVWMVLEGMLDVFVLETRQGTAAAARDYFFSASPGQGTLGLDGAPYSLMPDSENVFLAVGRPGTIVAELPLERFKAIASEPLYRNEAAAFIDAFLIGLSVGLTKDIVPSPKGQLVLPSSGEIELAANDYASSRKAPVWMKSRGRFLYIGLEEISPNGHSPLFPVTQHTWVQVMDVGADPILPPREEEPVGQRKKSDEEEKEQQPKTLVTCISTREALASGKVWEGIAAFEETLFNALIFNARFVAVDTYNSMKERMRSDERSQRAGLRKLAGVLDSKIDVHISDETQDNALIVACEMVAGALGMPIIPPLKKTGNNLNRTSVEDIASSSRIRLRRVALRENWWKHDAGPMVAHIDEGRRPVALIPTPDDRYEMRDPVAQTRTIVTRKTAREISDFGYCFYPYLPERPVSAKELIAFGVRASGKDLRTISFMGLLVGFLGMVPPMVMAQVFSNIVPYADRSRLVQMTAILLACSIGAAGLEYVRNVACLRLATRMHGGIEAAIMDRILRMPLPFFRGQTSGDLAERAMGVTRVREVVSGSLIAGILNGFFALFNVCLLFYYQSSLTWWVLGGLALYTLVIMLTWTVQLHFRRILTDVEGRLSGKVLQFITGIPKLRAGGGEGRVFSIWARQFGEQRSLAYKAGLADKWLATFNSLFPVFMSMGVFLGVVYYSSTVEMDTGVFIAFYAAYGNVMLGLTAITASMTMILNTWPYAERMAPILSHTPEVSLDKTDPGELTGRIEIQGLTFRYNDDAPMVLKNITLKIEPGEFVALAGHSGSGKSTLMRLLLGFESPTSGSIYYDDLDLMDLDSNKVRRNMGVVIQNSSVMPGSLFTNIVGTRQLTLEDAWEAARKVGLYEDIQAMPMKMHTVVTEGGSTLSGGQKQRLLIARALVNRPRILFLDEATSALDNRNQTIVSESLERVKATRVVVAHRLSTIKNADRIVVLDRGEVREIGTYDELMQMEGLFHNLVQRQLL